VSSLDRILPFLKPIEDLLLDPAITEVMVNEGGRRVFVEREGVLEGIPTELADAVAKVLRESQSDKESFVRSTTMRPQQQQLTIRAKLDRAYDDRLSGRIPDDLWTSKSAELEEELRRVRAEMAATSARATITSVQGCKS
jgi:hypothetical protein